MKMVLLLDNERTQQDIERLRGSLTAGEFVLKCFVDGLRIANATRAATKTPRTKDGSLCLGMVEPRFSSLSEEAVRRAVMRCDKNDPVYAEVKWLAEDYRRIVELHRMETGRELQDVAVVNLTPIQQVALEMAVKSFPTTHGFATVREVTKH